MSRVRIYLTGAPLVESGDSIVDGHALGGRQGRLVFAMLAWERHRAVPKDEVAELLWPDEPPGSWESTLAAIVSNLRSGLAGIPAIRIEHAVGCYQMKGPADTWVDVEAVRGAVHEAEGAIRRGDIEDVYAWTGVATAITRRPFLAGEDGRWIDTGRRELRALRMRALDCAVEFCIWNREWGPAQLYAETLISLDPLRESSHRRLIAVHGAAGDRAAAVRAYEHCRQLLAAELGVTPHPETDALYERMLGVE